YENDEGEACQVVVRGRYVGLRQRFRLFRAGKCGHRQGIGSYYTFIDISGSSEGFVSDLLLSIGSYWAQDDLFANTMSTTFQQAESLDSVGKWLEGLRNTSI
ncbi:hypothetical protein Tco_1059854, partial [Tanacetum coccineum]